MPIKASAARLIEALAADLDSDREATREAAVARLTVVGARAVDRLLTLLDSKASAKARVAALQTLEAIADARALDPILDTVDDPDAEVAGAAVSAARVFLHGPRGATAVDRLTRAVLDTERPDQVRSAALRALGDLEQSTVGPLLDALRHDSSEAIQAQMRSTQAVDPAALVARAADRGLPSEPDELAEALARAGGSVALPLLLRVIERVREREASEPERRRPEWTRIRGGAHAALASRGSRLALYDLRESLEAATSPLPVEFLSALEQVGNESCLEAIVAAYARATPAGATGTSDAVWWREHLATAFRTIVTRERLTRRHSVLKKIEKRWGTALSSLLGT